MEINKDKIAAIIFGLFSLGVIFTARQITYKSNYDLGHGFFPLAIGIFMFVLAIFWFFNSTRVKEDQEQEAEGKNVSYKRLAILVGTIILATLLVSVLGYFTSLGILVIVVAFVLENKKGINPYKTVLVLVVVEVIIYLIFGVWIGTDFPGGLFI